MPHDHRHAAIPERVDQPEGIAHALHRPPRPEAVVKGDVRAAAAPVAAMIRRHHVVAGLGQRQHHLAPAIRQLRIAVHQEHEWPPGLLEAGLQDVHGDAVVVVHEAGANPDGDGGLAVGDVAVDGS